MKTQQEYIEQGEQYILKTYNRFPVVLEKGEGVYLYDADQKKYLDFGAGIAVFALGYGNEAYNQALKDQIDKLIHTSNLYYNIPAVEAAKKIVDASGLKKVFFTNSGTEAIEGALKVARKYAYNKDDSKDYEFIAMNHSFHGRSQGALSVTGNSHYQDGFVPKEFRAVFAEFNNLEDVVSKITDKTCGIICEVVQGEGAGADSTDDYEDLDNIYTDPEVAKKFVEMTNVDCLAVAFGTTHGVYLTEPKLDLPRVARLREATNIPLVMHGGSGVSDEDYAVAIENGICKVNYYTYMNTAGGKASKEYWADDSKPLFYDSMSLVATEAIKEDVKRAIKVFQKIK